MNDVEKKTVTDIDVKGKRVLVRVDFNVPLGSDGSISDDSRIRACIPTIHYLTDRSARVILCSHLGRPHGKPDDKLRMLPVAGRLAELLGKPVLSLSETTGVGVEAVTAGLHGGDIVMLENLRFSPGEETNDPEFARDLARLADIYVNDAFGASHRAHASVVGVASYIPAVAGLLMAKELRYLTALMENPARPFAVILGGAKVAEKIGILENIVPMVDTILIGGGAAATFLSIRGISSGASPIEPDVIPTVKAILKNAAGNGVKVFVPKDFIVAQKPEAGSPSHTVPAEQIPEDFFIVDIGPLTIEAFASALKECRTVAWNGPMGIFEIPEFSGGTRSVATALAGLSATTVIGGGSTAEAVTALGLASKMSHVSTGGGAFLRFLSGKELPGVTVLAEK